MTASLFLRQRNHATPDTMMTKLLDELLDEHSPKTEPYDASACRAMDCQIVVAGVGPIAGVLSETGIAGVYRMTTAVQKPPERRGEQGVLTMAEYFLRADDIKTLVFERKDLADLAQLAKKSLSDDATPSGLWTPSSGKKP